MWLDAEGGVDPESESGRALIMSALYGAEQGHGDFSKAMIDTVIAKPVGKSAAQSALDQGEPTAADAAAKVASGHTYHSGPPSLFCSVPWGLMLLRAANPEHTAVNSANEALAALDSRAELAVEVDWGALEGSDFQGRVQLMVRCRGEIVAQAEVLDPPAPLRVTFSVAHSEPGEAFVASLSWSGGSRNLHCLAPLQADVRLDGLLAIPPSNAAVGCAMPPSADLLVAEDAMAQVLPLAYQPERAVGIEMELLTVAPDPAVTGLFTKKEELLALIRAVEAAASNGARENVRLRALLARCAMWSHEVDDHVMVSPPTIARRAVDKAIAATRAPEESGDGDSSARSWERLHAGGAGTMKSEFKSPPPAAGALSFANDGAAEIAMFVRLVRHLGAGAPALSATGNSGSSVHVHVNVRNPVAGGDPLSCMEILNVFFAWVRFDGVTSRFARPWMWREPSMAPLYATGAEFAWRETAWQQGSRPSPGTNMATYDVPTFVRAVRECCASEGFESLSEESKLSMLFGAMSPASGLGRYCSLNLRRLTSYGTLEFRRFHGTLDESVVIRWTHFCAAFVDCFRAKGSSQPGVESILGASTAEEALTALADAQETATADQLMAEMGGRNFVHGDTAAFLMRDSGALRVP